MKTKILTLLVLLAIAVVSCQKDEKEAVPQDVTFGIEQIDPSGLKGDFDCPVDTQGNLLIPVKAEVIVGGVTYFPEV
ncbi:MAG: hypothetical protein IH597_09380, partial [Bacteroidales bacterium]|nr:hypothetical protein [Bacteroidales bacterium]